MYFIFALNFSIIFSLITKHILQQIRYLNSVMTYAITTKLSFYNPFSFLSIHSFLLILYLVWVVSVLIFCCSLHSIVRFIRWDSRFFIIFLLCLLSPWLEISPVQNLVVNRKNLVFGWWPPLILTRAWTLIFSSLLRRFIFSHSHSLLYSKHHISRSYIADSLSISSRCRSPFHCLRKHITDKHLERNGNSLFRPHWLSPAANLDGNLDRNDHFAFCHICLPPVFGLVMPTYGHDLYVLLCYCFNYLNLN